MGHQAIKLLVAVKHTPTKTSEDNGLSLKLLVLSTQISIGKCVNIGSLYDYEDQEKFFSK